MDYFDLTPVGVNEEYWTVALVTPGHKEVHFGVFTFGDAIEAEKSGKIRVMDDQCLELRRIRRFPK